MRFNQGEINITLAGICDVSLKALFINDTESPPVECPITAMLELIGGKWKPIILYNLTFGTRRFGQIDVRIPGISRKVLTEQLRELEKDGLITRKQFNDIPPRVACV